MLRRSRAPISPPATLPAPPSLNRVVPLVAILAAAAGALVGGNLAGASAPPPNTAQVNFVSLTPIRQVWGGNGIAAGNAESVVVIGGSTTVPSNATTVRFLVTVKGAKAGTLTFYPAGNPAGASGDTVSWTAGGTTTATVASNVGMSNKLTVANSSAGSATVTLKITGYSTQVNSDGISGIGGAAGQTLVNNGAGGATWQAPGRTWSFQNVGFYPLGPSYAPVAVVNVPAGKYLVHFSAGISLAGNPTGFVKYAYCNSGADGAFSVAGSVYDTNPDDMITGSYLTTRNSPGSIVVNCLGNTLVITDPTLVVLQVGEANIG